MVIVISATIDYNGSTIATVTNETKILTTGGKWVTGNIKITDVNEAPNVTQDQEGYVVLDDGGTPQTIVNPLSITSNGTYSASSGHAFNPVVVDVGGLTIDDVAMRTFSGAIGGSATQINNYAFMYCSTITDVNFPLCTFIYGSAFANCYSLVNASFSSCSRIYNNAFYWCSLLTTISFPVCENIGSSAFYQCSSLTNINFPECIDVSSAAFYGCNRLLTANFSKCASVATNAFGNCYSLASISFPVCTSIGVSAFQNCRSLTEAIFPSCTFIGSYAFSNCYSLIEAKFPSCTSIGDSAFQNCRSLTTALFNNSSTAQGTISTYAFRFCYNLLSLYLLASTLYQLSLSSTTFISTPIAGYTTSTGGVYGSIFVLASLYDSYISSTNWSYFSERFVSLTESQVSYVLEHGTHIMS